MLDYQTAPGTSLAETNRELTQVEGILKKNRYVYTYSRRTGAGLGGDLVESYQGDLFVRLVAPSQRPPIWTVMDDITSQITNEVPGITFDTHQLLDDMIGDMVGRRQPIVVTLSAKDPAILDRVADEVAHAVAKVPGIEPASVNNGVVPAGDALEVHVDLAAAAMEDITPAEIDSQLDNYLHGAVATSYLGTVEEVGVRLWLDPPHDHIYQNQLRDLLIRAPNGHVFPLATVAEVKFVAGQPQITRDNLAQVVAVTAQISGDRDLGSTAAAVKSVLAKPGLLPSGVYYQIGGGYEQQQLAVLGMIKVFAAAAIGEIILLLFLYERFTLPAIIALTGIASQQWSLATVHFNAAAALTRDEHIDYFLDTIIEGPHDWPVRPVCEFSYELDVGQFETGSGLIGAIWQVKDNVAVDFAVRGARINDHTAGEIRAGVTFAFGVTRGSGLLPRLTGAVRSGGF